MTLRHANHAWQFECILSNGKQLKSWFYADNEQDATRRITEYMGAKLMSIKEIDDPLEIQKKEQEKIRIKEELANKTKQEHSNYE